MRETTNETQPSTIAGEMIENTTRHLPTDFPSDSPLSSTSADEPIQSGLGSTNFESADFNDRIGQRAYEIYLQRGGTNSSDDHSLIDWLQAEAEIRARSTTQNSGQPMIEEDIDERYSTAGSKR